jgi:hypothetical protein
MQFVLAVLFAASLYGAWHWWTSEREVVHPPGVLAPDEPVQVAHDGDRRIAHNEHVLHVRARFDIEARVLRKSIYRFDGGADVAPVDLGVGWGPMSDSAIVDLLEFSQMGRFLYWKPRDPARFPLAPDAILRNAAQLHLIPATGHIESRLKRLRPGQRVGISGYLVDVTGPGQFVWRTSLSRSDSGAGACEIVYVDTLDDR